jgi:hypothetical protein
MLAALEEGALVRSLGPVASADGSSRCQLHLRGADSSRQYGGYIEMSTSRASAPGGSVRVA